jgi:hypothetical protein
MKVWVTRESSEEAEDAFWEVAPGRVWPIQHTANASLGDHLVVAKATFESQSEVPISGEI